VTEDTAKPARKRQARGQKRMGELLDAAAAVFAEDGFATATTNAIAARAGASPGTLYQFFPNKDAIAEALMDRYIERLRAAHGEAFAVDPTAYPLDELLDQVVDPMIAFDRANPGFHALLADPNVSRRVAEAKRPVQALMFERVESILEARNPGLPPEQRTLTAQAAVHIFRGLLPMIMEASAERLPAVAAETKRALHAYLAPLVGIIAHPPPRADLERSRTAWKELYRMVDEGRINFDHHENETS
jgi:AcrR family transcriptional regulator